MADFAMESNPGLWNPALSPALSSNFSPIVIPALSSVLGNREVPIIVDCRDRDRDSSDRDSRDRDIRDG